MNRSEELQEAVDDLMDSIAGINLFRFLLNGSKYSYAAIIGMTSIVMFPFLLYIFTGIKL